ncbi:MAG: carboxypeptidase-like regulatory domain-containing protein, partial [Flavobacteriaceae bacterium]
MKRNLITITSKIGILGSILLLLMVSIPLQDLHAQDIPKQEMSFTQYKGEVLDSQTNNPLVFANIALEGTNISTVTNTEGEFLLKVPENTSDGNVLVSFLGYKTKIIPLNQMRAKNNRVQLDVSVTELAEVNVIIPKSAERLVRETLDRKGENYFNDATLMTAFY